MTYKIRPNPLKDFNGYLTTSYQLTSTHVSVDNNILGSKGSESLSLDRIDHPAYTGWLFGDVYFPTKQGNTNVRWNNVWNPAGKADDVRRAMNGGSVPEKNSGMGLKYIFGAAVAVIFIGAQIFKSDPQDTKEILKNIDPPTQSQNDETTSTAPGQKGWSESLIRERLMLQEMYDDLSEITLDNGAKWVGATSPNIHEGRIPDGFGILTYPGGTYLVGTVGSTEEGFGYIKYSDDSAYIGELCGFKPCGYGIIEWPDGHYYEGRFDVAGRPMGSPVKAIKHIFMEGQDYLTFEEETNFRFRVLEIKNELAIKTKTIYGNKLGQNGSLGGITGTWTGDEKYGQLRSANGTIFTGVDNTIDLTGVIQHADGTKELFRDDSAHTYRIYIDKNNNCIKRHDARGNSPEITYCTQ